MLKFLTRPTPFQNNAYAITWALLILIACGAPGSTFEEFHLEDILGYDKLIHATLFGIQAYLIIRTLKNKTPFAAMVTYACLASAVYGVLIELLQKFYFEGRAYDYFDMLANTVGCTVVWLWFRWKAKLLAQ
ncbi:MAG: VanZ family protein [Bacteroidota bacterium]